MTPADRHGTAAAMRLLSRGLAIGNRAVVATITAHALYVPEYRPGSWYDTRPMIDPREQSGERIDEHAELLSYAEEAGLLWRHPRERYMVCLWPQS